MTLHDLRKVLLEATRLQIRSGSMTGRGLARYLGVSQPHLYNVLHGKRGLTLELADQILRALNLSVTDFLASGIGGAPVLRGRLGPGNPFPDVEHGGEQFPFPAGWMARLYSPVVVRLRQDPELTPQFQASDLILLDCGLEACAPVAGAWYAVVWRGSGLLRRLEGSPGHWWLTGAGSPFVSRRKRHMLKVLPADVIRGRAVWIGRELE